MVWVGVGDGPGLGVMVAVSASVGVWVGTVGVGVMLAVAEAVGVGVFKTPRPGPFDMAATIRITIPIRIRPASASGIVDLPLCNCSGCCGIPPNLMLWPGYRLATASNSAKTSLISAITAKLSAGRNSYASLTITRWFCAGAGPTASC